MAHQSQHETSSPPRTREEYEQDSQGKKKRFLGIQSDPFIMLGAAGFILAFVVITILLGSTAQEFFAGIASGLNTNFAWLYIGGVSGIFLFLIAIFVSRFGNLRLGDDDEKPQYRLLVWFSMLFAAGMGATLMFWGAAEPLHHSYNPPQGGLESMSEPAIDQGFAYAFYHLTIHMWVVFTLPGLALGYFIYKRKLPPRLSSVFAPLMGGQIYRWPGKLVDVLSIVGTTFGIAVSVGLGVLQINAGLNIVWGVPLVGWVELLIILVITIVASISVASGLDRGIKILSNINIGMAVALIAFILLTGPTLTLLNHTVESFGIYASSLPELMFWTDSYNDNPGWLGTWTVFYWAWTICWSPFVGMFIARISRGRTVREFVGGVLALPSIFSIIWIAIMGRAGIEIELANPGSMTGPVVEDGQTEAALFTLLDNLPLTEIVAPLAILVIIIFFITSIDSASMVMDMFATGEENKTPTYYRVTWAVGIGAVTAAMLIISPETGIATLQEVAIIMGFPFLLAQFIMMFSLAKGMNDDTQAAARLRTRQWQKADSAEKLEEYDSRPAPGYSEEGEALGQPVLEYDRDGNIVIPGDVVVGGNFGVVGDMVDQDEAADMQRDMRIVEQTRPKHLKDYKS